jgi:hypothetical protein
MFYHSARLQYKTYMIIGLCWTSQEIPGFDQTGNISDIELEPISKSKSGRCFVYNSLISVTVGSKTTTFHICEQNSSRVGLYIQTRGIAIAVAMNIALSERSSDRNPELEVQIHHQQITLRQF